jgi:FeS assembly SUF system protein
MSETEESPSPSTPAAPSAPSAPETNPADAAPPPNAPKLSADEIENNVVEALKTVFDPEIPVNIYELGLIYDIDIQPAGAVHLKMTLTAPGCPVAGSLPGEVRDRVEGVPGVASAEVELVWEPLWNPSMMSEAARLQLGMF